MKKFLIFIISFIVLLVPGFFLKDTTFYRELSLPWFALPNFLFPIVWTTLYFCISVSISKIYSMYEFKYIPDYNKALISNYIFNELFTFVFFVFKSLFFGFVIALLNFITSVFLYYETKSLDEKASKWLIPYVLFNIFATILSLTIYFMNL